MDVQVVELTVVVQEGCFGLDLAMATNLPAAGLEVYHEIGVDA